MPRFMRITSAIAAVALIGGVATTATAATPNHPNTYQAAQSGKGYLLKAGPILLKKYGFKTEWLGALEVNGILGDCYDYGKQSPNGSWKTGSIADVSDPVVRTRMQFVSNRYWAAGLTSAKVSAARKSTENRLRSSEFRSDWAKSYVAQLKGTGVAELSDRMLAEANANAGPVSLKGAFTSKPAAGVAGTLTLTAISNGHAFPGQSIKWSVTNASTTSASKVTTNSGSALLRFVPNGAGVVKVRATLVTPEWRAARYSTPTTSKRQHLIRAGDHSTVDTVWAGSFDFKYATTVTQDCGVECAGRPPVTFTAQAGLTPVQWRATAGTKTVAALSLKAKASGSKTFTGIDGQKITFAYRVLVGKNWSGWRTASSFDVVCPAWPGITPVKVCACKGARTGGYTFTSPGGTRFYTVRLTIGGQAQEKSVAGNESVTLTGPIADGAHVTADFDAFADSAHTKRLAAGKLDGFIQD